MILFLIYLCFCATGVQYNDDFKKNISRFSKLPVLHDGDFKLTERFLFCFVLLFNKSFNNNFFYSSIAIVRYLSREYNLPEKWYPRDSKKQARVDEYLEWQHINTRLCCATYFVYKVILYIFQICFCNEIIFYNERL